jgi:hypothetical protein
MSSTASTSNAPSARHSIESIRQQAGPLPIKRGEIGFQEDQNIGTQSDASPVLTVPLPARHPADRDAPPPSGNPTPAAPGMIDGVPAAIGSATQAVSSSSSINSGKKKKIIGYLQSKQVCKLGVRVSTLLVFLVQLLLLAGTIVAWVFSVQSAAHHGTRLTNDTNQDTSADSNIPASLAPSTSIFIHVVFAIACIAELIMLERRLFRLRAERYSHLHPGEILPSSWRRGGNATLAIAPWNRPPLPTYAAALAESGAGTGDVEDHIIAQPPPPAYGNTRGSTFLLSGFMNSTLRAERPPSIHSASSRLSQNRSRPLSYVSRDEGWEEVVDADRAYRLEQTLANLEGSPAVNAADRPRRLSETSTTLERSDFGMSGSSTRA